MNPGRRASAAPSAGTVKAARLPTFGADARTLRTLLAFGLFFLEVFFPGLTPRDLRAEDGWQSYALPMAELEAVVTGWLERSGFEVGGATLAMGYRRLDARKGEEAWEIRLRPQSPLGSQLLAVFTRGGDPDPARAAALDRFVTDYLGGSTGPAAGVSNRDIPAAVLSRIESVVCIRVGEGAAESQISGVVLDRGGLILCVAHALGRGDGVQVVFHDGRVLQGLPVRLEPHRDLSLVRVAGKAPPGVSPREGRRLVGMGERVYSIGCPLRLGGTVFQGTVNGPPRKVDGQPLWVVRMEIYPGSSGSPVFDVQGHLVGMVKGRYRGTDSVGFLIPLETILAFLNEG